MGIFYQIKVILDSNFANEFYSKTTMKYINASVMR